MRAAASLAAILLATVLAAGCLEGKVEVTCNPDGSGKMVGEIIFPAASPWTGPKDTRTPTSSSSSGSSASSPRTSKPPAEPKSPEDEMKDVVANIIKKSSGIDAWKDVAFERADDGRLRLRGTAYFKDLSKVKVYPDDRSRLSFGSDGTSGLVLILNRPTPADTTKPHTTRQIFPDELAKRMKADRDKYQQTRATVSLDLLRTKLDLAFHLPGTSSEVRGLNEENGVLTTSVEGERILQAVDAMMADNATLTQMILTGGSLADSRRLTDAINKKVFGVKGEVWARMTGDFRTRFNYAAEVEAAKKAMPEMMLRLGLEKPKTSSTSTRPSTSTPPPKKPPDLPLPGKKAPGGAGLPDIPTLIPLSPLL